MSTAVGLPASLAPVFRVERELGAGGMARVFLAEEVALGRQVVIKVLRPDLAEGVSAERFAREIRLAARLQHPNVVPVFSAGEVNGLPYYTMPFVRGESLRARLTAGPLPASQATRVLCDVARALAYAHGEQVVHRDIKPENVLLADDVAVVADFGIAKAIDAARTRDGAAALTQIGLAIGTPAYMAPEQVAGDPAADHLVDIYAWGLVAYECLAHRHPFVGKQSSQELMTAQLVDAPEPLDRLAPAVPAEVAALVMRCLAKDPAQRPQSARALLDGLERGSSLTSGLAASRASGATHATSAGDLRSIAVLPFTNMSSDPDAEFFSDGMTEEILNALAKLAGLRVMARTSSFAFKGKNLDVREIGRQLGVGLVLEGSVRKAGQRIRITAQLIDAALGHHLWSERYDREMQDVFVLQDDITGAIRDALSARIRDIGPLEHQTTPNIDPETYELFLRGRTLVKRRVEGMHKGLQLLRQVAQRAPDYAPAYSELAFANAMLVWYCARHPSDGWPEVETLARRALSLDPRLADAHMMLGDKAFWYDWQWGEAAAHFERGLALDANNLTRMPWFWAAMGHQDRADEYTERALRVDPLSLEALTTAQVMHLVARRFDESLALGERMHELAPDYSEAWRWRALTLIHLGRIDEAVQVGETAVRLSGRHAWCVSALAGSLAMLGRLDEAATLREELIRRSETEPVPPLAIAYAAGWGQGGINGEAFFQWMERSVEHRDFWLVMLRADPGLDVFRDDPRFEALVRRVGLRDRLEVGT